MSQQSDGIDLSQAVNLTYGLLKTHMLCLAVFTRHSFGAQMPGFYGVLSLPLLCLAVLASQDIRMLWFAELWLVALVLQRVRTFWLRAKGYRWHSQYDGFPWLASLVSIVRTETTYRNLEPLVVGGLGLLLTPWSPAVGVFVGFGFVSFLLVRLMEQAANERRIMAYRDMQLEQQDFRNRV